MELKKATRQRIVSVARFRFAGDLPSEILQPFSEAATRVVPNKNLLKILRFSQENNSGRVFILTML